MCKIGNIQTLNQKYLCKSGLSGKGICTYQLGDQLLETINCQIRYLCKIDKHTLCSDYGLIYHVLTMKSISAKQTTLSTSQYLRECWLLYDLHENNLFLLLMFWLFWLFATSINIMNPFFITRNNHADIIIFILTTRLKSTTLVSFNREW